MDPPPNPRHRFSPTLTPTHLEIGDLLLQGCHLALQPSRLSPQPRRLLHRRIQLLLRCVCLLLRSLHRLLLRAGLQAVLKVGNLRWPGGQAREG